MGKADAMILLSVDPGSQGGIAMWDGEQTIAVPYPETEGDVLQQIITFGSYGSPRVAIVEAQVGVMGKGIKVSSSSMFTFGRNYGYMLGVLQTLGYKMHLVRPMAWQKVLSLGTKAGSGGKTPWKNKLKAMAQQLYPNLKVTLKTADALLILEYARRMRLNAPTP